MENEQADSLESLHAFAREAVSFEVWARQTPGLGQNVVRDALIRLTRLYSAALLLPPYAGANLSTKGDRFRLSSKECEDVVAYKAFPLDWYSEIFNPLEIPPDEPVTGSLADDIRDIYRDVVSALRAYEQNDLEAARWDWGFGFSHHWGEHATGAIRALHAWLTANVPDENI